MILASLIGQLSIKVALECQDLFSNRFSLNHRDHLQNQKSLSGGSRLETSFTENDPALRCLLFILIAVGFRFPIFPIQTERGCPAGWIGVGGVDVGGLSRADAYGRIQAVYSRMVELRYQGAAIHASTKDLGLNVKPMPEGSYHPEQSFWDYLWNNPASALDIHLELEIDQNTLRTYLTEQVAARYDRFQPLRARCR